MSRCFPYPPPGYTLSSARKDALIESIKLQKEKVKSEEQRKKERKREKKDKKKDKKVRKNQNLDKSGIFRSHIGENFQISSKSDLFKKESKAESEQLERSSITEEHEKPVSLHVPSTSSDSTENSNKRKWQSSPPDISRGLGNIIRIRLPSKKPKQSNASADEQQPCSTSGRVDTRSHEIDGVAARLKDKGCTSVLANSNVFHNSIPRTEREQICSTSKQIESAAPRRPLISSAMTPMQKEDLRYENLIGNWAPPLLQDLTIDEEDQDWLFPSKAEGIRSEKRRICRDENLSFSSNSSLWPCASYLPEVDIYALPFTVPF